MFLYEITRQYKTLSVIGMCKNAGKTTAMNALIRENGKHGGTLGLTSIGRDGESVDVVTKTHKPGIYVLRGTVIATASAMLRLGDTTNRILDTTGISTPLGEVVVVQAESDGSVQLAGPSMTSQLKALNAVFFEHGCERVYIDGALSRKSLCAPAVSDATVLCTGASYSPNIDEVVADTSFACALLSLSKTEIWSDKYKERMTVCDVNGEITALSGQETILEAVSGRRRARAKGLLLRGAVTDARVKPLISSGADITGLRITAEDGSKLLISRGVYEKLLMRGAKFDVIETTKLCAVTVNPISAYGNDFDKRELFDKMSAAVNVSVINVMEAEK